MDWDLSVAMLPGISFIDWVDGGLVRIFRLLAAFIPFVCQRR